MNLLGLFAKEPCAGHVKTRLAAAIGNEQARELYEEFVNVLLRVTETVAEQRVVAFSRVSEAGGHWFLQRLNPERGDRLWEQPEGGLGKRLQAFTAEHLQEPGRRLVIIGTDSPNLPVDSLRRAFKELAEHDVVLGPAKDGGYYLIGIKRPQPALFEGIDWGSGVVLKQTLDRVHHANLSCHVLPEWYDVDTREDLELLVEALSRQVDLGEEYRSLLVLGREILDRTKFHPQ